MSVNTRRLSLYSDTLNWIAASPEGCNHHAKEMDIKPETLRRLVKYQKDGQDTNVTYDTAYKLNAYSVKHAAEILTHKQEKSKTQ